MDCNGLTKKQTKKKKKKKKKETPAAVSVAKTNNYEK